MLNVLPPVVPVKRIHLHIVARKCHRYRNWKNPAASSKLPSDLAAPGGSRSVFGRGWRSKNGWVRAWREAPRVHVAEGCLQGNIDVLEEIAWTNATKPFRGLDEVVAGLAGMLAAEGVGENEGFSNLTCTYNKACAVDGPCTFNLHKASPVGGRAAPSCQDFWLLVWRRQAFRKFCGRSRPRGAGFLCAKWSDCTRRKGTGQLHKSCATAKFFSADCRGSTWIKRRLN